MAALGTIITLDEATRKLYCYYDYSYFLKRNLEQEKYAAADVQQLHQGYQHTLTRLQHLLKQNKRQGLYHIDGVVRKLHSGGLLPMRFELDESRSSRILRFEDEGEAWAYFEIWRKHEKRKIRRQEVWEIIVKVGASLGILLSIMKVIEAFNA